MKDTLFYEEVYDMLMTKGDAPAYAREAFVHAFIEPPPAHQASEWRCVPKLGFGGKFWRNAGRFYVSYYPEDRTVEREKILEEINDSIDQLVDKHQPNPDP
jgi:hypothetical protein